jgi:hypothetical protein
MARRYNERRSLANAIDTYIDNLGWTDVTIKEGWQHDQQIQPPMLSIHFLPSAFSELEIGRGDKKRDFIRRVQIDCYMENESRAEALSDDIADFIDDSYITVHDVSTSGTLGYMFVPDTGSITTETVPPIMTSPKVGRWRGVIKATYEVFYE